MLLWMFRLLVFQKELITHENVAFHYWDFSPYLILNIQWPFHRQWSTTTFWETEVVSTVFSTVWKNSVNCGVQSLTQQNIEVAIEGSSAQLVDFFDNPLL